MEKPFLKQQEIPHDSPESCNHFTPSAEKPFVATPAAIEAYGQETIIACLLVLQSEAERHDGLDRLAVFDDPDKPESLWFIEDQYYEMRGVITALLPSDH